MASGIVPSSGALLSLGLVWEGLLGTPFGEVVGTRWLVGAWSSWPWLGADSGLAPQGVRREPSSSGVLRHLVGSMQVLQLLPRQGKALPLLLPVSPAAFQGTDMSTETSFPSAKERAEGCSP